jgi:hypothetical protein
MEYHNRLKLVEWSEETSPEVCSPAGRVFGFAGFLRFVRITSIESADSSQVI